MSGVPPPLPCVLGGLRLMKSVLSCFNELQHILEKHIFSPFSFKDLMVLVP